MAQQDLILGTTANDGLGEGLRDAMTKVQANFTELYKNNLDSVIVVKTPADLASIDSAKVYVIDGQIDMGANEIEVPATGITIQGLDFNTCGLFSSEDNYTMFKSPVGGSGDVLMKDAYFTASGASSIVFNLVASTGNEAIEIDRTNFNGCTNLMIADNYRQILGDGLGVFGGSSVIELKGAMNGCRITTSIVRGVSGITSFFKAGAGLVFSGRFITDINIDLPATGALLDYSDTNFTNNESLQIKQAFVTRQGVIDASDTTIFPNIDNKNVKSFWSGNTGMPNTNKYIKEKITTEVLTVISAINTFVPLLGTFTLETSSHFDSPTNGQFRLLSGNGTYQFSGNLTIDGIPDDILNVRIVKSTDDGATFPTELNNIVRNVNNLQGGNDVAFIPINFISELKANERVRLEIENQTGTGNVTLELDSYFIISAL